MPRDRQYQRRRRRYPALQVRVAEHETADQIRLLHLGQLDLGLVHLPVDLPPAWTPFRSSTTELGS
ncbi:LysR substrate-binding domain-containing protein [Actinoplanes sp. ATCC 53533]|uniref:LysR substrate-binding domain-containing protein n=1 Tax=Actinoplanes sp. ATCC 53533 TaxID=1288362 RepID=UPI000F7AC950|nr:LysR substrate-binding domain-containing protein [Actinoplanes sp. ATCC 53533]